MHFTCNTEIITVFKRIAYSVKKELRMLQSSIESNKKTAIFLNKILKKVVSVRPCAQGFVE